MAFKNLWCHNGEDSASTAVSYDVGFLTEKLQTQGLVKRLSTENVFEDHWRQYLWNKLPHWV